MTRWRSWKEFFSGPTKLELVAVAFTLLAAAFVALVLVYLVPEAWGLIRRFAIWLDWKIVALAIFLILYVYSTPYLWHKFIGSFTRESRELLARVTPQGTRPPSVWNGAFGGFLAGIFVFSPDSMLYELQKTKPVWKRLWENYVKLFHPHIRPIVPRATCAAAAIWVWIYTILFFANFWPQGSHCAWKFPKIFSCLLTTHETLSAGLIGAGVAVWAAWLAWIALQRQIVNRQDDPPQQEPQPARTRTGDELARLVLAKRTRKRIRPKRKRTRGRPRLNPITTARDE